jgi:plastocyanin
MSILRFRWVALGLLVVCLLALGSGFNRAVAQSSNPTVRQIIVPDEDRFTPFAITIRVGQRVQWVNNDTDDHTIVSDDAFNTSGPRGINVLLPANGGTHSIVFRSPGTFPFYCRFHAQLDSANQPVAPGPDGGIQDPNGNYGTPMSGVITVVEK